MVKSTFGIVLRGAQVLFLKRSETTSRPGQWGLPGGGIKSGESPEEACIREIAEEAGLAVSVERSLGKYSHTEYFLCSPRSTATEVRIATSEASEYVWCAPMECMSIGEIMDLSRLLPLFDSLGLDTPAPPEGLLIKNPD